MGGTLILPKRLETSVCLERSTWRSVRCVGALDAKAAGWNSVLHHQGVRSAISIRVKPHRHDELWKVVHRGSAL